MKRILPVLLIINILCVSLVKAQNSGGPFTTPPPPPSGNRVGGNPPTDDFLPPPDPTDTPIDSGIIFLLILGTAYGITKMGRNSRMILLKKAA